MMDIDDFKKVNDVYGHGVGDQVLTELATELRSAVRSTDVVCRIGGEEFAVIVPAGAGAHAAGLAARLAQRLGAGRVRPRRAASPSRSASPTAPSTRRTRGS